MTAQRDAGAGVTARGAMGAEAPAGPWARLALALASLVVASVAPLHAQATPPGGTASSTVCPEFPPVATPSRERTDEARRAVRLGNEAAIVGDQGTAREHYERAAELNPADGRVAYYLAR